MLAAENSVILPGDLNHSTMHTILLLVECDKLKKKKKKIVIMRTTQPAIDTAQMKQKMGTDPSLSSDIEEGFMAGVKNLAQTYYNAILLKNHVFRPLYK